MRAIFLCDDKANVARVYGGKTAERLRAAFDLDETVYTLSELDDVRFQEVEVIFSTWGMPNVESEKIKKCLPKLKALFYAAGSVQNFARNFLESGVRVFSAWRANAIPVVDYTLAQIILANKGFYSLSRICKEDYERAHQTLERYNGNYNAKVGIIGDGAIGGQVIRRLKDYNLQVYVFSITMTQEEARALGVELASLEQIFSECDVISNHLANNEKTKKMIGAELINRLKPYATFINTARGAQVDEAALIAKCKSDPTITAVLDVTDPEPPAPNSELYALENVVLTPHIAGSSGEEVKRMGEYMADEAARYLAEEACLFEVTPDMLKTMA